MYLGGLKLDDRLIKRIDHLITLQSKLNGRPTSDIQAQKMLALLGLNCSHSLHPTKEQRTAYGQRIYDKLTGVMQVESFRNPNSLLIGVAIEDGEYMYHVKVALAQETPFTLQYQTIEKDTSLFPHTIQEIVEQIQEQYPRTWLRPYEGPVGRI